MSSFFDEASLVMIPSGYKDQKVYSVKPLDGSGDLTFSRASNATRVASNGLIEKVRTNLLLQSNSFDTTWNSSNATETSGQSGYDGTNNAWLLEKSDAFGLIEQSISNANLSTFSVYIKAGTLSWGYISLRDSVSTNDADIYINLADGSLGTSGGAAFISAKTEAAGNGYYRCSLVNSGGYNQARILPADGDGDLSGTSGNILIQNAQLELGDIGTDYIPTTTTAVSVGPVSGLPRLDYLNSSCPRLLLEPQRTNLVLNNISYIGTTGGGEGAFVTGPDGYLTGRRPIPDSNSRRFEFSYDGGTFSTGAVVTYSWFVKVVGTPANPSPTIGQLFFDVPVNNTPATPYKVADYADGWERWAVACTIIDGAVETRIRAYYGSIIGVGNDAIAYHGHQIEVGTYPTSVIYTLSTSVTRVADAASKTGISSLIGQTEGVMFIDYNVNSLGSVVEFSLNDGSNANSVRIRQTTGKVIQTLINDAGSAQASIVTPFSVDIGNRYKAAIAYKENDFAFYVNGVQIGTDTNGTVPSCSAISTDNGSGSSLFSGQINQALVFKTRLTNAQLAELTTL
jgi:hypothetical protein